MPEVEAAYLRTAGLHDRAALQHEEAAALFDEMGLCSLARDKRARARLERDAASTERELARVRHGEIISQAP